MRDYSILAEKARTLRLNTLDMILKAGSGHIGGSFSIAELVTALFYGKMNLGDGPEDRDRDRFILSKGHANPILYSVLIDIGWIDEKEKDTLRRLGSPLQGHPDSLKCPCLDCSTGDICSHLKDCPTVMIYRDLGKVTSEYLDSKTLRDITLSAGFTKLTPEELALREAEEKLEERDAKKGKEK